MNAPNINDKTTGEYEFNPQWFLHLAGAVLPLNGSEIIWGWQAGKLVQFSLESVIQVDAVTSVGLSLPTSLFSVSGSPVTTSGTLTGTLINQAQASIFAGPSSGGAGVPAFRPLVSTDLPTVQPTQGGTGQTTLTQYNVLLGNAANPVSFAAPAATGTLLASNGTAANPSFQTFASLGLPTLGGNNTFTGTDSFISLQLPNLPAHTVMIAEAGSNVVSVGPGATGQPLLSGGASADPAFGTLGANAGGTGQTALTAHAVLLGEGTGPIAFAVPSTANFALLSTGATSDPAFQPLTAPMVNYLAPWTNAVVRTEQSWFQDFISVKDFGALGNNSNDDTTAIQDAINYAAGIGAHVYFPFGTYLISASLVIPLTAYYMKLHGCGYGSQIKNKTATSFDLISFAAPGAGLLFVCYVQIEKLMLNNNGSTGSGNCINTSGTSDVFIEDVYLAGISTTGYGIFVNGNTSGSAYSHEITLKKVRGFSSTGAAFITFGALASDFDLDDFICEGSFGVGIGLLFQAGSASGTISNCHVSNTLNQSLYLSGNLTGVQAHQFNNCYFDTAQSTNVGYLLNATNCQFNNCTFGGSSSSQACLALDGTSAGNLFQNLEVISSGTSNTGIIELTASCNNNIVNGFVLVGAFTTAVTLQGFQSAIRPTGVDYLIAGGVSITAGSTQFIGNGIGNSSENLVQVIVPRSGFLRQLEIQSSSVPGASQTYTATARINTVSSTLTAAISGTSSFGANAQGYVAVTAGQTIDIQIVASAGAATASIRASLCMNA